MDFGFKNGKGKGEKGGGQIGMMINGDDGFGYWKGKFVSLDLVFFFRITIIIE